MSRMDGQRENSLAPHKQFGRGIKTSIAAIFSQILQAICIKIMMLCRQLFEGKHSKNKNAPG